MAGTYPGRLLRRGEDEPVPDPPATTARPWPRYGAVALGTWVRRLAEEFGADGSGYVYFNNDPGGAAIADATAFARIARARGLSVSRTPQPGG